MLTVIDRRGKTVRQLDPAEQEAMLAAFARASATEEDRERGAAVVREVQRYDRWLSCDCLGPGTAPPILVPVRGTYIRRRRAPNRPDHADGCPFEMDARDRERLAESLRAPRSGDEYKLASAFPTVQPAPVRGEPREGEEDNDAGEDSDEAGAAARRGPCKVYQRDSLARLLFELLHGAKVNRLGPGPREWEAQGQALHAAARGVRLGADLLLSDVLETDPNQLDAFVARIQRRRSWPKGRRPHGVLVFVVARIEGDALVAASGTRVVIDGPISVFGPGHGRVRYGPFTAAVLVASPDGRSPPAPLKAYVHPCWSDQDMLPVDSTHERRCLSILTEFRDWMAGLGLNVEVQKPLFDRSLYYAGREDADVVVKPDFEGKIHTASGDFVRSFVVEVMGFDHPEYQRTKCRLRRLVEDKRIRYIEHAAHGGVPREQGDAGLRRALKEFGRQAIERAATLRRPTAAAPEPRTAPRGEVPLPLRAPIVQDPVVARPPPSASAEPPLASPLVPVRPTVAPPLAPEQPSLRPRAPIVQGAPAVQDPASARPLPSALAGLPPASPPVPARPTAAPPSAPEQPSRLRRLWNRWNRLLGVK